ncbi:MAG: hypothetical protein ACYDA9_01650 [Terriglobia bacterium]
MKTVVVGLLALVLSTGCNQPHVQQKAQPSSSRPRLSATEEFNLRGKCAALADEMAPGYGLVGAALNSEVLSHYNPETNRCYVQVTVTKNFSYTQPSIPSNYLGIAIYDGQTKEMLVYAYQVGDKSYGVIYSASDSNVTYDKASAEIGRLMHDRDNTQEPSK